MRFLLLIFLTLVTVSSAGDRLILSGAPPEKLEAPKPKPVQSCSVSDLYVMAWTMHDPMERRIAMLEWLDKNVCSTKNYEDIWNSLGEWSGASDNALLRAKVIQGYEKAFRRENK
jgi:hypothetical protein